MRTEHSGQHFVYVLQIRRYLDQLKKKFIPFGKKDTHSKFGRFEKHIRGPKTKQCKYTTKSYPIEAAIQTIKGSQGLIFKQNVR